MPPFPSGRATIIRFPQGAPAQVIHEFVASVLTGAKAWRKPKSAWVAMIGEFFMGEGAPVVVVSSAVPKNVVEVLLEAFTLFCPTVRRTPLKELAFRGRAIVYFSDDLDKTYPPQA